jgi:NOL1/NOP2/sun family putative RNA methylase
VNLTYAGFMTMPLERYKKIFGKDFEIAECMRKEEMIWNVRVNTLKIAKVELLERFDKLGYVVEQVPWIGDGLWVKTNGINLAKTLEHVLGYFFLQNASSMVPPLILDPVQNTTVLDICAAPGAKTTQIAAMMKNDGAIVANDITHDRLKALRGNLQRCGVVNTVVTQMRGGDFDKTDMKFDYILLDAPCGGTGTLNPRIMKQSSMPGIRKLSRIQKILLSSAAKCLRVGGVLIYSTCSLEPEENEENVDYAVKKLDLQTEKIELQSAPIVECVKKWDDTIYEESVKDCVRIKPTEKNEGFFVCKLTK